MATIKINYDNARANAKKLQSAASDCAACEKSAENSAGGVGAYWNGTASDAFVQLLKGWIKTNKTIEQDMNTLAAQIIKIANEMEAAEKKIAAAAGASALASTASSSVSGALKAGLDALKEVK